VTAASVSLCSLFLFCVFSALPSQDLVSLPTLDLSALSASAPSAATCSYDAATMLRPRHSLGAPHGPSRPVFRTPESPRTHHCSAPLTAASSVKHSQSARVRPQSQHFPHSRSQQNLWFLFSLWLFPLTLQSPLALPPPSSHPVEFTIAHRDTAHTHTFNALTPFPSRSPFRHWRHSIFWRSRMDQQYSIESTPEESV
jgi:hypothetical protein